MCRLMIEILFGAGASAYSQPTGCPPLGKHLYRCMREQGLIPPGLPEDVIATFETDENFERGMELLASYDDNRTYVPLLRNMARFFCRFVPSQDNVYRRLFDRLKRLPVFFHATSLNYENLADQCKRDAGFDATICKPHGSCGLLPELCGLTVINPTIRDVAISPVGSFVEGCPVNREIDRDRIEEWLNDKNYEWIPPVMSFYSPNKNTVSVKDVVENERREWCEVLAHVDQCFIIGVACNPADQHIWQPLATSNCEILFVNPIEAGFDRWLVDTGRENAHHVPLGFADAIRLIGTATGKQFQ